MKLQTLGERIANLALMDRLGFGVGPEMRRRMTTAPEGWPRNRAEVRARYKHELPSDVRRKVFGRWRHQRLVFADWSPA